MIKTEPHPPFRPFRWSRDVIMVYTYMYNCTYIRVSSNSEFSLRFLFYLTQVFGGLTSFRWPSRWSRDVIMVYTYWYMYNCTYIGVSSNSVFSLRFLFYLTQVFGGLTSFPFKQGCISTLQCMWQNWFLKMCKKNPKRCFYCLFSQLSAPGNAFLCKDFPNFTKIGEIGPSSGSAH